MTKSKLPAVRPKQPLAKLTPLQIYLREIAKYPLLEPEEEYQLAQKHFEEGDTQSAHRLVTSNLRLVVKIANDFRQAQINLMDLIQEGNYGLMKAVKRFNPYKGVKLSSYSAWWIKAYILKHIMDNKSQVKMGTTAAQRKLFFNLKREADKLLAEYDRVDTKLLAEKLDVREKDVIEMQQRLSSPDTSLDKPVGDGDSIVTHGDMIPSTIESAEDLLADREIKEIFSRHVDEFRETLKGRDKEIFDARLVNEDPLTLQAIGDRYGVSRERARQLEAKILKKLREFVKEKGKLT